MKKLRYFLIGLILINTILSCASNQFTAKDITGTYHWRRKANIGDFLLLRFRNVYDTLILQPDHRFYHKSCVISEGHWELKGKKIYLYTDSARFRIDSINDNPKYDYYLNYRKEHAMILNVRRNKLSKWHGIKFSKYFPFIYNLMSFFVKEDTIKNDTKETAR